MVGNRTRVEQAPDVLVYRAGKWYPILSCIKKVIRPWMHNQAYFRWSGVPYANSL